MLHILIMNWNFLAVLHSIHFQCIKLSSITVALKSVFQNSQVLYVKQEFFSGEGFC